MQGANADDIVDFELNVCDTQAGVIGGARSLTLPVSAVR